MLAPFISKYLPLQSNLRGCLSGIEIKKDNLKSSNQPKYGSYRRAKPAEFYRESAEKLI
jgi:hypothetical protein